MKWWKAIKRFFNSLTATAEPSTTTAPERVIKHPVFNFIPAFFFVIGHNAYAKGTRNEVNEEYEYDFSIDIAGFFNPFMDIICPIIPVFKLIRPIGKYGHQVRSIKNAIKKITNKMQSYGLNSHFNDGGGFGNENLILKGSKDNFDNLLGDNLSDCLEVCLGIPQRRRDGLYEITENHNGGGMLGGMADVNCTSAIIEPTWKRHFPESDKIFLHKKRYAQILAETVIVSYLMRGLIKKTDIKEVLYFWNISGAKPVPRRNLVI